MLGSCHAETCEVVSAMLSSQNAVRRICERRFEKQRRCHINQSLCFIIGGAWRPRCSASWRPSHHPAALPAARAWGGWNCPHDTPSPVLRFAILAASRSQWPASKRTWRPYKISVKSRCLVGRTCYPSRSSWSRYLAELLKNFLCSGNPYSS